VYYFDGSGYAVADDNRVSSKLLSNFILEFKTYWDNASLFFVGNEETVGYPYDLYKDIAIPANSKTVNMTQ